MRIGIDARPLLDTTLSGVGEYTLQLLTALLARNDGHHYVLFANSMTAVLRVPKAWPPHRYSIKRFRLPDKLLNGAFVFFRYPRVRTLLGDIDVFFVPNHHYLPRDERIPMVLTVHDLSFWHFANTFSWKKQMFHRVVHPVGLYQQAKGIIAVSKATADDLCRTFRVPREKVFVVHSGIRHGAPNDDALLRVRQRFSLPDHFLFSLSTIEPRKNLQTLLDAYAVLRTRHGYRGALVIAGHKGWSSKQFFSHLAQHPFRHDIRILESVSDDEKTCLYRLADVFLYLSMFEGFGFPPLEALVQGAPVVAGHHSSLSEVLGTSALLVDVTNVNDVVHATQQLLSNAQLRALLLRQRFAILERYTWSRCAEQTLHVLTTIASQYAHRD